MGMFDTVTLKCPNCKKMVDEQTKSGNCMLGYYTLKTAPMSVMAGVLGLVKCYHCNEAFVVEMVQRPIFKVRKLTWEEEAGITE